MKRTRRPAAAAALASTRAFAGCATVTGISKVMIPVNSVPEGAVVSASGDSLGTTPAHIRGPRGTAQVRWRIEKPGYEAAEVVVQSHLSGWLIADVPWGGVGVREPGCSVGAC